MIRIRRNGGHIPPEISNSAMDADTATSANKRSGSANFSPVDNPVQNEGIIVLSSRVHLKPLTK